MDVPATGFYAGLLMHPQRMDLATLSGVPFAYGQQVTQGDWSLFDLSEIGVLSRQVPLVFVNRVWFYCTQPGFMG